MNQPSWALTLDRIAWSITSTSNELTVPNEFRRESECGRWRDQFMDGRQLRIEMSF